MGADAGNVSELFVSFQGEGLHAGRRQLFVRLGGCPLRCRYCDEPESLVPVAECRILGPDGMRRRANPFSPAALDAEVTALAGAAPPLHAIAVTGGEPLAQADFLASWLALRTCTLPVLLETAGILPARLAIGAGTLERLHALASRIHPDVRVLPQLHKVLGIP